jgi:hypothetical protein
MNCEHYLMARRNKVAKVCLNKAKYIVIAKNSGLVEAMCQKHLNYNRRKDSKFDSLVTIELIEE